MKKSIAILALLIPIIVTCKKEGKQKTMKEYLMAHDWNPYTWGMNGNKQVLMDSCFLDNIHKYRAEYFEVDEGAIKCGSAQIRTGRWKLDGNKLTTEILGFIENFTILSIDDTKAVFNDTTNSQVYYTITLLAK